MKILRLGEGGTGSSGASLAAAMNRRLAWYGLFANAAGAVFVLAFLIHPRAEPDHRCRVDAERTIPGFIAFFMVVALPFGRWRAADSRSGLIDRRLRAERPANIDGAERRSFAIRSCWACRSAVMAAWGDRLRRQSTCSFGWVNTVGIAAMTALGGLASCSLQYLVVERLMPLVTARVLAGQPAAGDPGDVPARSTMAWTLATGVFLGMGGLALAYLVDDTIDETQQFFVAIVLLAANGLAWRLRRRRSPPATSPSALSDATARWSEWRTAIWTRVEVDDGSEVGLVQAGFNRTTEGLAERERARARRSATRSLDTDVAEHILREGPALEGEQVDVTAMFVETAARLHRVRRA